MRSILAQATFLVLGAGFALAACRSEGSLEDDDATSGRGGALTDAGGSDATGGTTPSGPGGMALGGASASGGSSASGGASATTGASASSASSSASASSTSASVSSASSSSSASTSSASSSGSGGGPLTYDNCGYPNDGPWMEIDYGSAYTVTSPSRTYSNTPGFGEAQWTPSGQSFPEVWFIGGGSTQVSNDPIGKVASVGPGAKLQMMIGLGSLVSYSHATVCVEGRSVSTSASVLFDAYNPKHNCGASGQMSHSWAIHATGVDIGQCLIPGDAFQAVRLEPWGGSSHLGVRRVRVTLHGAVY